MRTTLTLEPDVAARLEECQAADLSVSFKELVNGLLRMAFATHKGLSRTDNHVGDDYKYA